MTHRTNPPIPRVRIESGDDIPVRWGEPRAAMRKGTVAVREPQGREGREVFATAWGTLTATPGVDVVIVQDSGEAYPVKKDIFAETYQEIAPGRYRRTTASRLVQVPAGVVAVLATREGELEVRHPDYLVIGAENEVYANSFLWVTEHLEFS